jgi:hypothetical protein
VLIAQAYSLNFSKNRQVSKNIIFPNPQKLWLLVANQLLLQGVIGSGVLLSPQGNRLLRVLSQRRAVVPHQCPLEDNGVQTQIKQLRPHLVNWANNNYQTKIAPLGHPKVQGKIKTAFR